MVSAEVISIEVVEGELVDYGEDPTEGQCFQAIRPLS